MADAKQEGDIDVPTRKLKKKKEKKSKARTIAPPSMVPPSVEPPQSSNGAAGKGSVGRGVSEYDLKRGPSGAMTSYDIEDDGEPPAQQASPKNESFDGNEEFYEASAGGAKGVSSFESSPDAKGSSGFLPYPSRDSAGEPDRSRPGGMPAVSSGGLGSAGPLPGGGSAQSRARVLAQQRELQMKRRQQAMSGNQAMMRSTEGVPSGVTPAMRQFGASSRMDDAFGGGSFGSHSSNPVKSGSGNIEMNGSSTDPTHASRDSSSGSPIGKVAESKSTSNRDGPRGSFEQSSGFTSEPLTIANGKVALHAALQRHLVYPRILNRTEPTMRLPACRFYY